MATRAIVTSQPDVACDMCGRRLLRGEQAEAFLAGVERRTVCELCAPRAAYEGWTREADAGDSLRMPPSRRRRRGASLLGRLRQLREPAGRPVGAVEQPHDLTHDLGYSEEDLDELVSESGWGHETVRFAPPQRSASPVPVPVQMADDRETSSVGRASGDRVASSAGRASEPAPASELESALELFNAGEHPRRMGGVARSLGDPSVSVRAVEGSAGRYTIVVAWELCWYRYEVNLDEPHAGAQLLEKGMELDELPGEDRLPNAAADERGELSLVP